MGRWLRARTPADQHSPPLPSSAKQCGDCQASDLMITTVSFHSPPEGKPQLPSLLSHTVQVFIYLYIHVPTLTLTPILAGVYLLAVAQSSQHPDNRIRSFKPRACFRDGRSTPAQARVSVTLYLFVLLHQRFVPFLPCHLALTKVVYWRNRLSNMMP